MEQKWWFLGVFGKKVADICHLTKYLPPLKLVIIQNVIKTVADLQMFWQKPLERDDRLFVVHRVADTPLVAQVIH